MPKVIFITGASSGFGRALAVEMAAKKNKVYGTTRRPVEPVPGVNYVQMDVTDRNSIEQAVKQVYDQEGRIDVVINNAGMGIGGPLEMTTISDAQYQFDVNFFGVYRVTQTVLPIMRRQKEGTLIYMSSIGGLMGLPFQGLYSASKFAVEGYCQALRLELKPYNIRVVLINPGDFSTNFTANRKIVDNKDVRLAYPQFHSTLEIIKSDEQNGLVPQVLAKKAIKIIERKKPAFHYVVASPVQKASIFIQKILPESWYSVILEKYYNRMSLKIKEVTNQRELKKFIKFPNKLYKDNQYYIPPLISGEIKTLSEASNPAFEHCEAKLWLACKNHKIVGRVAGIINRRYNKKVGKEYVRFGWLDFIKDEKVLDLLLGTVESWAAEKGMKNVHGPLGFTDFDASGILVEGFEELPTSYGKYNYPYYPEMIEKKGYTKEVDWFEYNIKVPDSLPERYVKAARLAMVRNKLHCASLRRKKDFLKYADEVFQLVNQQYGNLHGFSELSKSQIEDLKKQFVPVLSCKYVAIVLNEKNRVVGFGVSMPSLSKALQRSNGRMYPFGFLRILYALWKNDTLDTLLIAIDEEYKNKGINAIIFSEIGNAVISSGITNIESTRELEDNFNVQNLWNKLEYRQHKRARCYVKQIG